MACACCKDCPVGSISLLFVWKIVRYQTRELKKQEVESREKKAVSVVISKDGEEPLSQKELYKKKIAKHFEKRKANGGESPAESPEVVAKPRPKYVTSLPHITLPLKCSVASWSKMAQF